MDNIFKCVVCGGLEYNSTKFYARDNEEQKVVKCNVCGHVQLFPHMTENEYKEEYDKGTTFLSNQKVKIAEGNDLDTARTKWCEWNKKHIEMYWDEMQSHNRVLDLGAGFGFFEEEVNKRKDRTFTIEGVEIGAYRLEQYVGGKVHTIDFGKDAIPENMVGKYDLILSMHLLEHLYNPLEYLMNIKPLLAKGGKCIFEVPNDDSYLKELSPEYERFFYLSEHISSYSDKSLRYLFEKAGYNVSKVYTKELYSLENHLGWIRTGKPFIKYNQMYMPDERLEPFNIAYQDAVGKDGKGYALIIEAIL